METKVSVVIPCYNAARFVGRAVASALNQTGVVCEVIAVNDASSDDTTAVLAGLARAHPGLRVLDNPANLGPAGTRNRGIAAATGDWVALLDADDAFAPGRLARLIGVAEAEGVEILSDLPVLHDLAADSAAPVQLPADGSLQRLEQADLLRPDPASGLDFGLLKPVFRRSLAEAGLWVYPETLRHGEDFALYFDLLGRGVPFAVLHEAHYIFSTRIGAVSGAYSPGSVTQVDYRAIAAYAETLSARHNSGSEADRALQALLAARVTFALRQNRIYGWTALRKRDLPRLGRWLRADRRNVAELGRMIAAKLGGHRGLPD